MTARVLVVDDIVFNVKLLETKLKQEYYDVFVASNGIEAVAKAKEIKPDIILMDVMMPEMDGIEATRLIKADPEITFTPIIMVTALNAQQDKVNGLNAGADDFLTKPINDQALMIRLKSLLRLKFMADELQLRDTTGKQLGFFDKPTINEQSKVEGNKILVVDDDMPQSKKIKERLCEERLIVDICSNEQEALELALQSEYSLFIISTQLIDSDGLRLCSHIRSSDKLRHIPILVMVEEGDERTLSKGLEIGVNDYLQMPIEVNELVARTATQLRRKSYQDALRSNYLQSMSLSITDGLTNLYNRRYFDIHIKNMLEKAKSEGKTLSLMMLDIDHFKKVNDVYGHTSGDCVIQDIARKLLMSVRPTDLCSRYGGEEFVVILPDTSLKDSATVAERMRSMVEQFSINIPADPGEIKCTVSIGVATATAEDTPISLLERADKCLYYSKEHGRNRTTLESNLA